MLVNGVVRPSLTIRKGLMRFRILNGSNARIYNLRLSYNRKFHQIATDGGLLGKPVELQVLRLAPGEREETLDRFSGAEDVLIEHQLMPERSSRQSGRMPMMMGMVVRDDSLSIIRLKSEAILSSNNNIFERLVSVREWNPGEVNKTRRFELRMGMGGMMGSGGGFTINGKSIDINRIDETVKLNAVEIWEIFNNSPRYHPFYIHNTQFRIVDRDGKPAVSNEQGLKDIVLVEAGETARVTTQFENYTDPEKPYLYHCHILVHEDAGMMGQFTVPT